MRMVDWDGSGTPIAVPDGCRGVSRTLNTSSAALIPSALAFSLTPYAAVQAQTRETYSDSLPDPATIGAGQANREET